VKNLVDLVGELHKQGVQFKSLTDAIDTGTASGLFFFHVMASLAEMERELTIERTRAGLEVARQLGRKGGRKRQMTESKIKSAKKLLTSCRFQLIGRLVRLIAHRLSLFRRIFVFI
jgi:DNA invertase Pin-like site-specific DNA recombinase